MNLLLKTTDLLSRRIRTNLSQGRSGSGILQAASGQAITRRISNLTRLGSQTSSGGLVQQIWNGATAFAGWIGGLVKGIAFSVTGVWGWLVERIEQLKNFDWNASDVELTKLVANQNTQMAALWGNVVGSGLGWLAGIAVGGGVGFLCPVIGGAALAKAVIGRVGTEAASELFPAIGGALAATTGLLANKVLIAGYINFRRMLKKAPRSLLEVIYGKDGADFIQDIWGRGNGPKMSFNEIMEESIDSIKNDALRVFIENLFEEAWDSFMEAGFIVAQELDNAFQQNKLQSLTEQGTPRSVILKPDVNVPEELTFSKVPQQLLYPVVQQTLNQHRLVYNRDMGQIIGQPVQEWARARPQLRQLTIEFRDKPTPPWRHVGGKRSRTATYTIPDAKFGLTWEEIKLYADSFMWGRFRATAQLDNQRQMAIYGATASEANKKLKELLRLSTANILTLAITEEEDRPVGLKKEPTRMYPAHGALLARRNSIDSNGRKTIDNRTFDEEIIRFDLWTPSEPKNMPQLL